MVYTISVSTNIFSIFTLHCNIFILLCKKVKYTKGFKGFMRKSTRSILQELSELGISRDKDQVIESRGANLIESAINLLTLIREQYDIETAAELERRFVNAIRTSEPAKFKRGMKKIQESKGNE
jgi:hypothetical protein